MTLEDLLLGLGSSFFSTKDKKVKSIFGTVEGKRASTYRRLVLKNTLSLARARKYPLNIPAQEDVAIKRMPYWTSDCETNEGGIDQYIMNHHTKAGQAHHETKSSNIPEYKHRCAIGNGEEPNCGASPKKS